MNVRLTVQRASLVAMLLFLVCAARAGSPPITDAEKAACEIVVDHLARGPVAFAERISETSALATVERTELMREITARVGPHRDASWELRTVVRSFADHGAVFYVVFPSGADDVVTLDLIREGDRWMIRDIRTLAEVSPDKLPVAAPATATAAASRFDDYLYYALLLAPLLSIAGALVRHRRYVLSSLLLTASFLLFAATVATIIDPQWKLFTNRRSVIRKPGQPQAKLFMGELSVVRREMAQGTAEMRMPSSLDATGKEIAALWKISTSMDSAPPERVREQLRGLKILERSPLASLIRARLAARDGNDAGARKEYAAVHNEGPAHDAFLFEEWLVGEGNNRIVRDTRDANYQYTKVIQELAAARSADTVRQLFQEAWHAQPVSRRALVSGGIFSILVSDEGLASLVHLHTPKESSSLPLDLSRSPMTVPAGARARVCGTYLQVAIDTARLEIPGGSSIAPRQTTVLSAEELEREQSVEAMRLAASLDAPSLESPRMQRAVESAVTALAARNHWEQIDELTRSITPSSIGIAPSLVLWRTRALVKLQRFDEARALATSGAVSSAAGGPDVDTYLELSEHMAAAGAWDAALDLTRRASQVPKAPDVTSVLRRLELRKQLATSEALTTTAHFSIHGTPDVSVPIAERVGQLLEAELQRLSGALGATSFRPIRVNVTRWDEFSGELTGSDHIVGFYDGEITVPFGEVARFRDGVVAILTHELTHAIVAQQSDDNAPRWFQEGLAQRMELLERQENVFQTHRDRFVALAALDATLGESLDANAVASGYTVASTLIRYIEDRYGAAAIPRMISAFGKGKDTNETLQETLGVADLTALDVEFRQWGATHSAPFIDRTPWPYLQYYSPGIDPAIRNSIRFSRRGKENP